MKSSWRETHMNEQTETSNQSTPASLAANDMPAAAPRQEVRAKNMVAPQDDGGSVGGLESNSGVNGGAATLFVYAIGRVEARFPNLAAEKEFAQAAGRTNTAGKTDQQTFHAVLSKRENR